MCLFLLALTPLISVGQDRDQYVIAGRVVDEIGSSIGDSGLWLFPAKPKVTSSYGSLDGIGTDPDGRFRMVVPKNTGTIGKDFFLFVSLDKTPEALTLVSAPFVWIREHNKHFDGQLIRLGDNNRIDLGDVRVQFWHGEAIVDFSKYKLETKTPSIDWKGLYLRVRDANGFPANEQGLSQDDIYVKKFVDNNKSTLRVSLPEGRWKVEVIWNKRLLGKSSYFEIRRNQPPVNVIIRKTVKKK